ncbi:Endoribonuclease XendoU-domain-containing protein [Chytriomyces cf. hyalinus JEL632]|nr:Endoribonuclease XendoU-domain-containing protein [Chytriomyces cf. hyalinus JEL632]
MDLLTALCGICLGSNDKRQDQQQQQQQHPLQPLSNSQPNNNNNNNSYSQAASGGGGVYAAPPPGQPHQNQYHQQQPSSYSQAVSHEAPGKYHHQQQPPHSYSQAVGGQQGHSGGASNGVISQQPQFLPSDNIPASVQKPVPAPTQKELQDLSAAAQRLWDLDNNRLNPGKDFQLNLQRKTFVSNQDDMTSDKLFKSVNGDMLRKYPTYSKFLDLLPNFTSREGVAETVTDARLRDEKQFIDLVYQTSPIQYLHKYLIAKKLAPSDPAQFKTMLNKTWFELYKRRVRNDTSAFEHTFAGEVRDDTREVMGFHNWLTFYVEEKAGRADYRGFILPKTRGGRGANPTGNEHVLSFQLSWNGDVKPVSTILIGVSPEYELALYTMVFLAGKDDVNVPIIVDDVQCEVVVHRFTNNTGPKIGSAYVSIVK